MNRFSHFETDESYPYLRESLAPEYAELAPEELEELVENSFGPSVMAEDLEDIFGSIAKAAGSVGKAVGPVLTNALPGMATGAMAGSALGPFGMLGGAILGGATSALAKSGSGPASKVGKVMNTGLGIAGSLSGGGLAAGAAALGQQGLGALAGAAGRPSIKPRLPTAGPAPGIAGSPAAGQLLALLGQPQVLQALQAMMLGPLGRSQVSIGDTPVPVGAFTNLLGSLAQQASAESIANSTDTGEAIPEYLLTENEEFRCDIANPEARAQVLWELLQTNAAQSEFSDDGEAWEEESEPEEIYDAFEWEETDEEYVEEVG